VNASGAAARAGALRARIADASRLLEAAEEELELEVRTLVPIVVGDKRLSTTSVEMTFEKVRTARRILNDLERSLASELASPAG
jgi:GTP-sensing pleiotropic transcriptional regulator CodY